MGILLVNSNICEVSQYARMSLPLGLAYIGAVLMKEGYEVSAIDLNLTTYKQSQMKEKLEKLSPRILAISATTPSYNNALKLAALAKEVDPNILVVIGGPHVSVTATQTAREKDIDIVVIGEGEYALLEIAGYYLKGKGSLGNIRGISYKVNDEVKTTPRRLPLADVDALPFPARSLFHKRAYRRPNTIIASRGGCPFACPFCITHKIWGAKRVFRSPEQVISEISSIIDSPEEEGANRTIDFYDDALTLDRDWAIELFRLMQTAYADNPIRWGCMTRVDLIDEELLREMKRAGCVQVQYGVEAGSQAILDSINKKITLDQVRKAVKDTVSAGIDPVCFFMFPFPEDTEESIREQIRFMNELHDMGSAVTTALTCPDPGTDFYENADKLGLKILSDNWDDYDSNQLIISTRNLSREKLDLLFEELCREVPLNV